MTPLLLFTVIMLLAVALPICALPATLSLGFEVRPGIKELAIPTAAEQLRASGISGLELVDAARVLVHKRMAYCRRNSFEGYKRAFQRGYGYCSQQAEALVDLLKHLGFEATVVHALRNRFPDGSLASHAWVRVIVDGETHDVDSVHYDAAARRLNFTPLSKVKKVSRSLRLLEAWGAPAVNAHRYYRTGKDQGW